MIFKIFGKFKIKNNKDNKVLISNFLSLFVLQGANYILPLITFPYLVRVLGVNKFGLLAFASAIITYFNILTDYGFNLTATREVSIYRNNKEKLNEIFSSVMIIKFILMSISFLLLIILILSFDKFKKDYLIYILTFGTIIGQVLFPQWFFQGIERMKYITFLNILAKVIFTIAIFVFIHKENDYWKVPLINSLGFITAGIIALFIIFEKFHINFIFPSYKIIKYYLIDGWHVFISRISVLFYTSFNIFILGFFTNNTIVGYYSIAEKIISVIASVASVITITLFPYFSKIYKYNRNLFYKKFYIVFKVIIGLMFILSFFIYIFADKIIFIVSGKIIYQSIIVLKILAFTIILFPLGGLFTDGFISQRKNFYVTRITFYTSIINLFLVVPCIYYYGLYGLAFTVLIVQIFHIILNYFYFTKLEKGI